MYKTTFKYVRFVGEAELIAAGVGALGNAVNMISSKGDAQKDYDLSRYLMHEQNAMNIANWHLQNVYNSPSSVRSRQQAAGLNPLMHDVNGGTAQLSAPQVVNSNSNVASRANQIAATQALAQNAANIAAVRSQTKLNDSAAQVNYEDAANKRAQRPRIERESSVQWLDEELLTKWWNNNISSTNFIYSYASSLLQAKRAGMSPTLTDEKGNKVYSNRTEFNFDVSYEDAAKWVKTEFDDMVATMDLKRSQESYFYKTAQAAFGNLAVALSRASHQNNLDDANAELQRASKDMQELKTFMMRNGFNENDSPLDRMIKKFGEFIGVDFALPE